MASRPFDHIDVVVSGTLISSVQGWSTQLECAATDHTDVPGDISVGDLTAICDSAWTFVTGSAGLKATIGSIDKITAIRAYLRKKNTTAAVFVGEHTGSQAGSASRDQAPQVAMVITTLTGAAGRANRGRAYWPYALGGYLGSPDSTEDNLATAFADYIANLRTSVSSAWGTAAGPVVGNNGLLITRVKVDNVLDTQRRRRDKITPTHTAIHDVPIP